jgi:hypothetical protein
METKKEISRDMLDEIVQSIQWIKYGEVRIIVHDSKIVQIEKIEKKRFQN